MIPLMLSHLARYLRGTLVGDDTEIHNLSSDSRKIDTASLFVALKGERFDAHDFAAVAVKNGARALLVDRQLPLAVPQLLVEDTQKAMGAIAALVRDRMAPVCIALTGSNGKTSVKEMVATILSQHHRVLFTAGNFNNEIGVPLTLLRLSPGDEFGVFELGANHKGEIDYTSSLVKPDIALVNNVASAHLEGFGSQAGVAAAKAEIFLHLRPGATAIINADDNFAEVMRAAAGNHRQLSFAIGAEADIRATDLLADDSGRYQFSLCYNGQSVRISLPLAGRHQVSNALAATAVCLASGLKLDEIAAGLAQLTAVKGRMLPRELGRVLLVDDSYNANPASVGAAIAWLKEIEGNRCLVLGDLGELGENAALLHAELGEQARDSGIDALFCCGELTRHASQAFGGEHYRDLDTLVASLVRHINQSSTRVTILVKGSRSAAMERVVEALSVAYRHGEFV